MTEIHEDGKSNVAKCNMTMVKIVHEISDYMGKVSSNKGKKRKEVVIELPSKSKAKKKKTGSEFVKRGPLDLKQSETVHDIVRERRNAKQKQTLLKQMCEEDKKIVDSIFAELLCSSGVPFRFTDNPLMEVWINENSDFFSLN